VRKALFLAGNRIQPRATASRLSPIDLADILTRKDLADFFHEVLLDFLTYSFAHSVNNILWNLNIANLPKRIGHCMHCLGSIQSCVTMQAIAFFSGRLTV
jgi:hypothetical protein